MVVQHVVFHCNNNKHLYTQTKVAHEYVNSNSQNCTYISSQYLVYSVSVNPPFIPLILCNPGQIKPLSGAQIQPFSRTPCFNPFQGGSGYILLGNFPIKKNQHFFTSMFDSMLGRKMNQKKKDNEKISFGKFLFFIFTSLQQVLPFLAKHFK